MPGTGIYSHASFVIGEEVFVGTGTNESGYTSEWWKYNTKSKEWTRLGDFPGGARTSATGFSIGNKGYLCFGSNTPGDVNWTWYKDLWQYTPETDSWIKLQDFPGQSRHLAVSFVINGKAYVGTGVYRFSRWTTAAYLNDFWEYDPATDQWTPRASVPEQGRAGAMALSVGTKGYIGFGFYYYDTRKNDWWEYNITDDAWTRKADLPATPRYNPAGFSVDQKGYVIGGAYYSPLSDSWAYDPQTDTWTQKADFPGAGRTAGLAFSIYNKGYYGLGTYSSRYTDLWKYTGEWTVLTCPNNQELYVTKEEGCAQIVNGIDPIFVPANANPLVAYEHLWNGTVEKTGTGSLSNTSFKVGDNLVIYSLPEENGQRCTTNIILRDTIIPLLTVPATQTFCNSPTNQYTIPEMTYSDNCDLSEGAFVGFTISGATVRIGLGSNASGAFRPGHSVIHWKVTDPSGNTVEKITNVIIGAPLSVSIPPSRAVPFGDTNTVYIGYGPNGIALTANVTGGTPYPNNAYRYLWSNGATTRSMWLVPPAKEGSYQYRVTVIDAMGCQANAIVIINVKDVRCGNQGNKVVVCRLTKQGPKEFCLNPLEATLALYSGARLGHCEILSAPAYGNGAYAELFPQQPALRVSPNPSNGSFNLMLSGFEPGHYTVQVLDTRGRVLQTRNVFLSNTNMQLPFDVSSGASGTLLVRVSNEKGVWTAKVLHQ